MLEPWPGPPHPFFMAARVWQGVGVIVSSGAQPRLASAAVIDLPRKHRHLLYFRSHAGRARPYPRRQRVAAYRPCSICCLLPLSKRRAFQSQERRYFLLAFSPPLYTFIL